MDPEMSMAASLVFEQVRGVVLASARAFHVLSKPMDSAVSILHTPVESITVSVYEPKVRPVKEPLVMPEPPMS